MEVHEGFFRSYGNASIPLEVIKEAFATGVVENGHVWIEMLEKRNELSHTYNHYIAQKAVGIIKNEYFPAIEQVDHYLKSKK